MKVSNKNIIVTGAGNGIGRELTLQLLRKNANVAGVDININALNETQKIANVDAYRFKGFEVDITDIIQVEALPNKVINHFGTIDGIINNAGIIQKFIKVNDLSIEDIYRVMNVNFYGTVHCTKTLLPLLLERPEAHIVNMSSIGGFIPFPKQTIYGATKAAIKMFTEGLYAELKDTNVRVTVVHPGAIDTNITENSGVDKPNIDLSDPKKAEDLAKMTLSPVIAAEKIIQAMEQNRYRVTVGKDATFMDYLYRFNPKFATDFIQKQMAKLGI